MRRHGPEIDNLLCGEHHLGRRKSAHEQYEEAQRCRDRTDPDPAHLPSKQAATRQLKETPATLYVIDPSLVRGNPHLPYLDCRKTVEVIGKICNGR